MVDSARNLRGLYFKSSAATGDSFSFAGASTLTIGRGGITNYDADPQNFSAPITLGSHQYWDAGPGGLNLAAINTNGKLLEIRTGGTTTISGAVSGNGSLALSSGVLVLSGNSTFSGPSWVHEGTLRVTGSAASSSSLILASAATIEGYGQAAVIEGSGTVSPGPNRTILTSPSLDPSGGLDFAFEFTAASPPQFATASSSTNDLLRLTGATPFAFPLSASNRIAIYLDAGALAAGQVFRGGLFTDQAADFISALNGASFEIYVADPAGTVTFSGKTYAAYAGPLALVYSTEAQPADFSGGTVNGRILQIEVRPDPASYEGWAWSAFPEGTPAEDRLPEADPNGDGVTNLLACALEIDPLANPQGKLPSATFDGGTSELVFRFRRNKSITSLTYEVYSSGDLQTWSLVNTTPIIVDADPDGDGTVEEVEVRVPLGSGESRIFARLRVTYP